MNSDTVVMVTVIPRRLGFLCTENNNANFVEQHRRNYKMSSGKQDDVL